MTFPLTEIDFPFQSPDPDDPLSIVQAVTDLSRFTIRRAFVAVQTKTAAYTINATEDQIIIADATGGAFSVTLPLAADADAKEYVVKKIDAVANVTVAAQGAETIDGAGTFVLGTQYHLVRVTSDGTAWHVTGRHT